jgi:hypothetical protein
LTPDDGLTEEILNSFKQQR